MTREQNIAYSIESINCRVDQLYQDLEYYAEPLDGGPADEQAIVRTQRQIDEFKQALNDLERVVKVVDGSTQK